MKLLLALLLIVNTAYADECQVNAQVIKEGVASPCDGILLSNNAAKKADQNSQDLQYNQDLNSQLQVRQDYQTKEINILDERLKLYVDESATLAKRDTEEGWAKWAYFAAGVLGTGLAAGALYHNR